MLMLCRETPATATSWDKESPPFAILAAIQPAAPSEGRDPVPRVPTVDPTLQESQRADPELKPIFDYLEESILAPYGRKMSQGDGLGEVTVCNHQLGPIPLGEGQEPPDHSSSRKPDTNSSKRYMRVYMGLILGRLRCMGSLVNTTGGLI